MLTLRESQNASHSRLFNFSTLTGSSVGSIFDGMSESVPVSRAMRGSEADTFLHPPGCLNARCGFSRYKAQPWDRKRPYPSQRRQFSVCRAGKWRFSIPPTHPSEQIRFSCSFETQKCVQNEQNLRFCSDCCPFLILVDSISRKIVLK